MTNINKTVDTLMMLTRVTDSPDMAVELFKLAVENLPNNLKRAYGAVRVRGELTAKDLAWTYRLSDTQASTELKMLSDAKMLSRSRAANGTWVYTCLAGVRGGRQG